MKTILAIGAVVLIGVLVAVSVSGIPPGQIPLKGPFKAVVVFNVGNQKSGVTGEVELSQENEIAPVHISGSVRNLAPQSKHGFHVHENGDIRGDNPCDSVGGHYNPHGTHGAPYATERHVGDLGNIIANPSGVATVDITDAKISLTGPESIIGRAITIHEQEDDLGKGGNDSSLKGGNSGGRAACGIIGTIYIK